MYRTYVKKNSMKRVLFTLIFPCLAATSLAQSADYSGDVRTQFLPWMESVGRPFGLTADGLENLQWDEAFLTECPRSEFLRMQAVVNNPTFYNYQTGYYRLHSDRSGYLYHDAENPKTATTFDEANTAYVAEPLQLLIDLTTLDSPAVGIREIVNGKSVNGKGFDLSGRRVAPKHRSIYVQKGKKVIKK